MRRYKGRALAFFMGNHTDIFRRYCKHKLSIFSQYRDVLTLN